MAATVMKARKKFNVKYPDLYATADNCKNEDHRTKFNCVQRAHQNALENQPIFLALLLVVSSKYPLTAAAAGGMYLAGRLLYLIGYSTGNPDSRYWGGPFMMASLLTLVGTGIRVSYELLKGNV